MAQIKKFEDLNVWKAAAAFDLRLNKLFSFSRLKTDLGLRTQILNSSGSCQDNIAEGFERGGNKELMFFLRIAKGSIGESRSQLRRAISRNLFTETEGNPLIEECEVISKQIAGFLNYLKKSELKGERYVKEPETEYSNRYTAPNFDS